MSRSPVYTWRSMVIDSDYVGGECTLCKHLTKKGGAENRVDLIKKVSANLRPSHSLVLAWPSCTSAILARRVL